MTAREPGHGGWRRRLLLAGGCDEYQLALEIRGRGATRQLEALVALMGRAFSRPELAKRIQGKGSATVTKAIRGLDSKGLVRLGLMADLKTQRIELSALGARVLLVSQQLLPDAYRQEVTQRAAGAPTSLQPRG